jgi:Immunity protein 53
MSALLPFTGLQDWYLRGSDGELGPTYDIQIDTLDEPGWRLEIVLDGTDLAGRDLDELAIERTQSDWIHAWRDDHALHIDCGPLNLTEAIKTFSAWAQEPLGGPSARLAA